MTMEIVHPQFPRVKPEEIKQMNKLRKEFIKKGGKIKRYERSHTEYREVKRWKNLNQQHKTEWYLIT